MPVVEAFDSSCEQMSFIAHHSCLAGGRSAVLLFRVIYQSHMYLVCSLPHNISAACGDRLILFHIAVKCRRFRVMPKVSDNIAQGFGYFRKL